jgi:hypothetical protein
MSSGLAMAFCFICLTWSAGCFTMFRANALPLPGRDFKSGVGGGDILLPVRSHRKIFLGETED